MYDIVSKIMAWEEGELGDRETLEFFADLIKTGQCWSLQGCYGRFAANLIENDLITKEGVVTDKAEELLQEAGL
jgi:hypothetical protein